MSAITLLIHLSALHSTNRCIIVSAISTMIISKDRLGAHTVSHVYYVSGRRRLGRSYEFQSIRLHVCPQRSSTVLAEFKWQLPCQFVRQGGLFSMTSVELSKGVEDFQDCYLYTLSHNMMKEMKKEQTSQQT